jgi:hypothetical protein
MQNNITDYSSRKTRTRFVLISIYLKHYLGSLPSSGLGLSSSSQQAPASLPE